MKEGDAMNIADVQFTDNSAEVLSALPQQIDTALEAVGLQVEGYAKLKAPVDTGLLRNSITHAVSGKPTAISKYKADKGDKSGTYSGAAPADSDGEKSVYVGTNVFYAPYQEYGTMKTPAQPFLKPAVTEHTAEYKAIIEHFLKQ